MSVSGGRGGRPQREQSVQPDSLDMRAVVLSGRPANRQDINTFLSVAQDVARPSLKPDQVLVRVVATALNIEDIMTGRDLDKAVAFCVYTTYICVAS